ncbi:phytanoyl-CoA dioxygenase, peroxisomal [Anabrus simplex]|uniref:phytanoyl-CoA dioxygenase, peroxisomal n=1 Tax=Anabrus simplex TaxID=316456 RepID=UPI0035A39148
MLTEQQKNYYKENGFIKLENVFTPGEFQILSDEYDEIFNKKRNEGMEASWKGDLMKEAANRAPVSVLSIHNLQFHSGVFTRLLTHPKLMEACEDVMGTPNILLHHTKAHLKPPAKGAPYLMHQDYHYFPFKNDSMVAVFIHMDDSTPENGCLCVYPGSHKLGPLDDKGIEEKGEKYHYVDQNEFPIAGATPICAKKGDVVIFSYLLIHGSYLNTSDRVRRMFLIQLMAADDEPLNDEHKSPAQGMVLRGRNYKRDANMETRFKH